MRKFLRVRGFSLIEMLVALAVMSIGMLALTDYISTISNQQRILMQKAEAVAVDTSLTNIIASTSQHCSGNIKAANISFPSGTPPATPINVACPTCTVSTFNYYTSAGAIVGPAVPMGLQPDGSGLDIASIQLENIKYISTDEYSADVYISYGGPPPVPPSAKVATVMLVASTSGGSDTLQSCAQGQCAAGYTLVGGTNNGDALCISTHGQGPAIYSQALHACTAASTMTHLCTQSEWQEACLWDQPSPYGFDGDNGPILHMGAQVLGPGGRGNGGGTSEIVSNLVEVYDGSNWKSGPLLMGGTVVDTTQQNRCYSFKDWWGDQNDGGGGSYGYRCCYRP